MHMCQFSTQEWRLKYVKEYFVADTTTKLEKQNYYTCTQTER